MTTGRGCSSLSHILVCCVSSSTWDWLPILAWSQFSNATQWQTQYFSPRMKTFQENLGKRTNSTPSVLQHTREEKLEFDIFDGARSYKQSGDRRCSWGACPFWPAWDVVIAWIPATVSHMAATSSSPAFFFFIPPENDDWLFSSHVDFVIMICLFPQKAELLAWDFSVNSLGPHWKTHILLWESMGCLRGCNTGQRRVLKSAYGYERRTSSIWTVLDTQKLK